VPGEPGRAELCQAEPGRAEPGGDVLGGSPGGANVPHVVSLVLVRFVCRCKIESAIYIYIYIYIYGSVRLIVFPGSAEKNTDLSPLEDPTCSRWKSVCFVAFLELPIDFKPIVSKLTYVWELLDVEQIKLPINLVLLETPLNKIIMGRITIGFPAG
jgi:hypothetical protein